MRDVFAQSLWQHRSMWFQVVREEKTRDGGELRKLTLAHLNPKISTAEVNGGHDNCLHYRSPVGDVWTLPLLSRQRVSPLPWPRSTFDLVWNTTARLLHPTKRREEKRREQKRREEKRREEKRKKVTPGFKTEIGGVNNITRQHEARSELSSSLPDGCQIITGAKKNKGAKYN